MGNYMSAEPPKTDWAILHDEVINLGEDFEVERGVNGESTRNRSYERCKKNPGHKNMCRESGFSLDNLPPTWRNPEVYNFIMFLCRCVVKINVFYISKERPEKYPNSKYKGTSLPTSGSGFIIIEKVLNNPPIDCPVRSCCRERPHKVTPVFEVQTSTHVVFDKSEAVTSYLTFFYDSDDADTVKGEVFDVVTSNASEDSCFLKCVSHDLKLFSKVFEYPSLPVSRPLRRQDPLVVIISHPHGYFKHVSFGEWVGYGPTPIWIRELVNVVKMHSHLNTDSIQGKPGIVLDRRVKNILDKVSNDDEALDFLNDHLKLSDYLSLERAISRTSHGEERILQYGGCYISAERSREMEQVVLDNPTITFGDFFGMKNFDATMSFITYTAATCPGSSGAQVFMFFAKEDGTVDSCLQSIHFRHHTKKKTIRKASQCKWVSHGEQCLPGGNTTFQKISL